MPVKLKLFVCLALLAILVTSAPAHASLLSVEIFVNGESVTVVSAEPDPERPVPLDFEALDASFQIEGSALLDIDPFLTFAFSALNFSENAQQFTFVFSLPYTAGPYDTLTDEFATTISDFDQSGAAAVVPAGAFMSIPFIDGTGIAAAGLGSGCTPIDLHAVGRRCNHRPGPRGAARHAGGARTGHSVAAGARPCGRGGAAPPRTLTSGRQRQ